MKLRGMTQWAARHGIFLALVLECIVFALANSNFFTIDNQLNVLRQNSPVAIIAIGMTFVILTGGIDLSVGSMVALAGVGCAWILQADGLTPGLLIPVAILGGIGVGGAAGALNSLAITKIRIPPFVATLAMLSIARGTVLQATNSQSISRLPDGFGDLAVEDVGGFVLILVTAAVAIGAWFILERTPFGRHVYAVGGNAEAARLSGIRVPRVLCGVYVISGLCAGLGGVMLASYMGVGDPRAGALYELDAIAAVVVGGTSLMGGRGSVWGTLAGALVIGELSNFLDLSNVQPYSQKIVIGLVLVVAAFLDRFRTEG